MLASFLDVLTVKSLRLSTSRVFHRECCVIMLRISYKRFVSFPFRCGFLLHSPSMRNALLPLYVFLIFFLQFWFQSLSELYEKLLTALNEKKIEDLSILNANMRMESHSSSRLRMRNLFEIYLAS